MIKKNDKINGKIVIHYIFTKLYESLYAFAKGVKDGASFHKLKHAFQCPVVKENVKLCIILNGIFFVGIDIIFNYIMMPIVNHFLQQNVPSADIFEVYASLKPINLNSSFYVIIKQALFFVLKMSGGILRTQTAKTVYSFILTFFFMVLWLLPVYIINILFSGRWYSEIASHAYSVYYGNAFKEKTEKVPFSIDSYIKGMADSIYSLVLLSGGMIIQGSLLSGLLFFPFNKIFFIVNLSLITSWSAFEMKWAHKNWSFEKKQECFEQNKFYFAGFGLLVALLTFFSGDFPISSGMWSFLFPFSIISSMYSQPVSVDFLDHEIFSISSNDKKIITNEQQKKENRKYMFQILLVPKAITNFLLHVGNIVLPAFWILYPMFSYMGHKIYKTSKKTIGFLFFLFIVVGICWWIYFLIF